LCSFCKRLMAIRAVLLELGMALGEFSRHNKLLENILCSCSPNGRGDENKDGTEEEKIRGSHSAAS
jgi:hypothetical protein